MGLDLVVAMTASDPGGLQMWRPDRGPCPKAAPDVAFNYEEFDFIKGGEFLLASGLPFLNAL
jgi:hypothetical protein